MGVHFRCGDRIFVAFSTERWRHLRHRSFEATLRLLRGNEIDQHDFRRETKEGYLRLIHLMADESIPPWTHFVAALRSDDNDNNALLDVLIELDLVGMYVLLGKKNETTGGVGFLSPGNALDIYLWIQKMESYLDDTDDLLHDDLFRFEDVLKHSFQTRRRIDIS
jgi:hypothetical protein